MAARNNIQITFADTSNLDDVNSKISEKTKLIHIETPSNPLMRISDLRSISKVNKKPNKTTELIQTFSFASFQFKACS